MSSSKAYNRKLRSKNNGLNKIIDQNLNINTEDQPERNVYGDYNDANFQYNNEQQEEVTNPYLDYTGETDQNYQYDQYEEAAQGYDPNEYNEFAYNENAQKSTFDNTQQYFSPYEQHDEETGDGEAAEYKEDYYDAPNDINSGKQFYQSNFDNQILPQDTKFAMEFASFNRYDTRMHGLGKRLQKLPSILNHIDGDAGLTTKFHHPGDPNYAWFNNTSNAARNNKYGSRFSLKDKACDMFKNCCKLKSENHPLHRTSPSPTSWEWTKEGKLKLGCSQPIIPVPIVQEIRRRDRIIEIPQVNVVDAVQPCVYNQGISHDVPRMNLQINEKKINIPRISYVERDVIVPIITGYTHKFVPKWEIREVPRPVVKYLGKQETIEVKVPQVKFVDKIVEREVVVDKIQKKIHKIVEIPKYVEKVQYVWKPVEKIIHINKYVPKFDVKLEIPPPLIVPFSCCQVKNMPSVMIRKSPGIMEQSDFEIESPPGTIRVPNEYIEEYTKNPNENLVCKLATAICASNCSSCEPNKAEENEKEINEEERRRVEGNGEEGNGEEGSGGKGSGGEGSGIEGSGGEGSGGEGSGIEGIGGEGSGIEGSGGEGSGGEGGGEEKEERKINGAEGRQEERNGIVEKGSNASSCYFNPLWCSSCRKNQEQCICNFFDCYDLQNKFNEKETEKKKEDEKKEAQ